MGPQANLESTTSSTRKVMAAQSVSPGLMVGERPGGQHRGGDGEEGHEGSFWSVAGPAGLRLGDGEEQRDDDGEERGAFDERGGDDHRGADVAGGGGLAGRALHGGGGELADAEAGADDGEAGADAGGEVPERELVHGVTPLVLQQRRMRGRAAVTRGAFDSALDYPWPGNRPGHV